jgi:hypothetical protein
MCHCLWPRCASSWRMRYRWIQVPISYCQGNSRPHPASCLSMCTLRSLSRQPRTMPLGKVASHCTRQRWRDTCSSDQTADDCVCAWSGMRRKRCGSLQRRPDRRLAGSRRGGMAAALAAVRGRHAASPARSAVHAAAAWRCHVARCALHCASITVVSRVLLPGKARADAWAHDLACVTVLDPTPSLYPLVKHAWHVKH